MEILKERSDYLRHPLMEELVTEASNISEEAVQLMKFHGSYMQDDRCVGVLHMLCCACCTAHLTCTGVRTRQMVRGAHAGALHACRDKRTLGHGKYYQFMMRTRQPAGLVSNQLYLTMDDLADQVRAATCCSYDAVVFKCPQPGPTDCCEPKAFVDLPRPQQIHHSPLPLFAVGRLVEVGCNRDAECEPIHYILVLSLC